MKKLIRIISPVLCLLIVSTAYSQDTGAHQNKKKKDIHHKVEILKKELNLDEDQTTKLKALYKERNETLKASRPSKAELDKMDEDGIKALKMKQMIMRKQLDDELQVKIAEILNEEQLAKYKELSKEHKMEIKEKHDHKKMNKVNDHNHDHGEGGHQH